MQAELDQPVVLRAPSRPSGPATPLAAVVEPAESRADLTEPREPRRPLPSRPRTGPIRRRERAALALAAGDVVVTALVVGLVAGLALVPAAAVAVGTVVVLRLTGGYRPRLRPSSADDLRPVALGSLAATVVLVPTGGIAGAAALGLLGALVPGLLAARAAVHVARRATRRRGRGLDATVVVGQGAAARRLVAAAVDHPEFGLAPVGVVGVDPTDVLDPETGDLGTPRLGSLLDLTAVVESTGARRVLVAQDADDPTLTDLLLACRDRAGVEVLWEPRFSALAPRGGQTDALWGIPLVRALPAARSRAPWRAKRALDVVVAAVLLLLLTPLMAVAALAVRWEMGRSIIFGQVRVGLGGLPFTIYKFRTYRQPPSSGSAPVWSVAGDPSLGPVGRFLRATSIDELPQLVNVLRGDMSLVGPRPERPFFVDRFSVDVPDYHRRHRVPVGLTGWAQVHGLRGDTSIEERARFDNDYIENWSLRLDLQILVRTVRAVLGRQGG
ncbi:exopolysaccharide biosynthesis polyprenyl glycosylphosphotransferase [Nocardioides litoris]|uniref:exopolysaccharide biosynthesis polyprenyl glycosylphosphotransferase n=1 Tax=Nocardioides litoris TaxID=1926648 RepID=UPI001476FE40|nr:exopolysaccharide biosynthesis polyprenyl glycosylphosphotransferase [Nocardioides litoris]